MFGFKKNSELFLPPQAADGISVSAEPMAPLAASSDFRVFAGTGLAATVGGNGNVFGTTGLQDITIVNRPGVVSLDPSFNRGGDVIRLSGNAAAYTVAISGSSAVLDDGDTTINIPIGSVGADIVFDDGARTLVATGSTVSLGAQTLAAQPATVVAPAEAAPPPPAVDPAATGRMFLAGGSSASVGGDFQVFGTTGSEDLTYLGGDVALDPSFNRGGDTVRLLGAISGYSAYVSGSTAVIISAQGQLFIPIGSAGLTLDFAGQERSLRYDSASATVKLGDLSLSGASAQSPLSLATQGNPDSAVSLDIGNSGTVETVNLAAGVSYVLSDNATKNTNVIIKGFGADDVIQVSKASGTDYNFSSGDADKDGVADDLSISFVAQGTVNILTLTNVVEPTELVINLATAKAAVGHTFITFANDPASGAAGTGTGTGSGTGTGTGSGTGAGTGTGSPNTTSIDVGDSSTVSTINLQANTSYTLSDNAAQNTNVVVNGFNSGDKIRVTGAHASDYNFSTGDDPHDLEISYRADGAVNLITLNDVVTHSGLVTNLASAEAAVGYNFIAFA